jgi:hypothetical protein
MPTPNQTKKFLIETSCTRPLIGTSTAEHCRVIKDAIGDGQKWSSVYIRMEYIRVWVCGWAYVAFQIEQSSSVSDTLYLLEQDFHIHKVKSSLAMIATYLQRAGTMTNTRAAAEEVASLALAILGDFDAAFASRINNACKCQIGSKNPTIDYNHLILDVHRFYQEFLTPVTNCEVNRYLQLQNPAGRAPNCGNKCHRFRGRPKQEL